jgi:carboxymethylenebutenolidase
MVVMKFKGNKITHEHIYWDRASLLTQTGLLDANNLLVHGRGISEQLDKAILTSRIQHTGRGKFKILAAI